MENAKVVSPRTLKQRIDRFFTRAQGYDLGVADVIDSIRSAGQTAIFGGMLRDMLLYGEEGFKSDIDLVVSGDKNKLNAVMHKFSPQRTSFGGYRLAYKHSRIDVWCLEDTWAFREGLVRGSGFQDLVKTTFFNWDAIVYLVDEKRLLFVDDYVDQITQRLLDINLEPNPNPIGVLKRTLTRIHKDNAKLSPRLASYLMSVIDSKPSQDLLFESPDRKDSFMYFCATLREYLQSFPKEPFEVRSQLPLWPAAQRDSPRISKKIAAFGGNLKKP